MLFMQPSIIGMELSHDAFFLLQLKLGRSRVRLESLSHERFYTDGDQAISFKALSKCAATYPLKQRDLVFAQTELVAKMERLILPQGLASIEIINEIKAYLREQSGDQAPLLVDYALSAATDGNVHVQFVAVPAERINHYVSLIKRSGFRLKAFDIVACAIARAVNFFWVQAKKSDPYGIIHCHDAFFFLIVATAKQIIFLKQSDYSCIESIDEDIGVEIKHWIFSGNHEKFFPIISKISQAKKVLLDEVVDYSLLQFANKSIEANFKTHLSDYLVAFGLALHKVNLC